MGYPHAERFDSIVNIKHLTHIPSEVEIEQKCWYIRVYFGCVCLIKISWWQFEQNKGIRHRDEFALIAPASWEGNKLNGLPWFTLDTIMHSNTLVINSTSFQKVFISLQDEEGRSGGEKSLHDTHHHKGDVETFHLEYSELKKVKEITIRRDHTGQDQEWWDILVQNLFTLSCTERVWEFRNNALWDTPTLFLISLTTEYKPL